MRLVHLCLLSLALVACSDDKALSPRTFDTENPPRLSDWGMMTTTGETLTLAASVQPYDLATPLFSDYAQKLRTVWMPPGTSALFHQDQVFDFPVGTVITKTFYYPTTDDGSVLTGPETSVNKRSLSLGDVQLMETRILVRRAHGWDALPYVWNEDQSDAVLKRTGAIKPLRLARADGRREDFNYLVPNANQCAACHATDATTKKIVPIGPKARHLNKASTFEPAFNQLDHWLAAGLLSTDGDITDVPANADWQDGSASLSARARAYLDINCSHCHNPRGAADTSGLNLEPDASGPALGRCKAPIAAGGGTGGRPFGIVPGMPDQSITVFRLQTTDPGAMMPELGRAVAHEEGVTLIANWIAQMDGECAGMKTSVQ